MDYFFIILALLVVVLFWVVIVKFILIPLFYPVRIPKKELYKYLNKKKLSLFRYEKIKRNNFPSLFKNKKETNFIDEVMLGNLIYVKLYFKVYCESGEIVWVEYFKSNSLYHKNKIFFYLEKRY